MWIFCVKFYLLHFETGFVPVRNWVISNLKLDLFHCEMVFVQMWNGICSKLKWDLFKCEIIFFSDLKLDLFWSEIYSIVKLDFFLNIIVWHKLGFMELTWTQSIDFETWYREGLKVETWSHVINLELWYGLWVMI